LWFAKQHPPLLKIKQELVVEEGGVLINKEQLKIYGNYEKSKNKVKEFVRNVDKVYSVKEVKNIVIKGKPKKMEAEGVVRANWGRGGVF